MTVFCSLNNTVKNKTGNTMLGRVYRYNTMIQGRKPGNDILILSRAHRYFDLMQKGINNYIYIFFTDTMYLKCDGYPHRK